MDKPDQHQITIPSKSKDSSPTATYVESTAPSTPKSLGDLEKRDVQVVEYDPEGKPVKQQTFTIDNESESENRVNGVDFEPVFLPKAVKIPLVVGLCLAILLVGLDNTISATAMPKIATEFDDLAEVSWIATAFIFAVNAFLPLVARFADMFGRRRVILSGLAVFLVGSALCGAAVNMKMLILMRAVQGVGGGAVFGCTLIIFADISPLEDRAKYQALVAFIFSAAMILGPLIGGSFADYVTWRWGFYINLPVGAVATTMIFFTLKLPHTKTPLAEKLKRLDYVGTALVVSAVTAALLAFTWGGSKYAWGDPIIIVLFVLCGICIIGIFIYEVNFAVEPIIPPHIFKVRTAVAAYIGTPFFIMAFFSLMYFLPLFWQVAKHSSATLSGLRLIPITIGLLFSSSVAATLAPRIGKVRELLLVGSACGIISTGLISLYREDDRLIMEIAFLFILGCGLGIMWSLGVVAVQSATEAKDLASATNLVNFFQMLGGSVGVAISSSVFFNRLHDELVKVLPPDQVIAAQNSVEFVHSLSDDVQPLVIHAYVLALREVTYVLCGMTGASFIAMMFVKNYQLKKDEKVVVGGGM